MQQEELVRAIEKAFEAAIYPGDDNLCQGADPEGIPARLAGRRWQDLRRIDLPFSAFPRLTDQALVYFLPAYLIAIVRDPVETDYMCEGVFSAFSPEGGYWYSGNDRYRRLAGLLTSEQREVLAQYLILEKQRGREVHENDFDLAIAYLRSRAHRV